MEWKCQSWQQLSTTELYEILALRQAIFVVEQDCPYQDADGLDQQAFHLSLCIQQQLAGYIRIFPPGQLKAEAVIGRVVVSANQRGQGLGYEIMKLGASWIEQSYGATAIWIGAQSYLREFYGNLGYQQCGPEYDEDGIPHIPMHRPAQ